MNQSLRWDQDGKRRYRGERTNALVSSLVGLVVNVVAITPLRVEMPKSKREFQLNFLLIYYRESQICTDICRNES